MLFPFLTIFIALILFLALRYRYLNRSVSQQEENFWDREMKANATPAKDITNISYLTIPLDKFPLDFSTDAKVLEIEQQLKNLSSLPILNLTGVTNTQLKELYGVPNLAYMQKVGENFDCLTILLTDYAVALLEAQRTKDAVAVLEYSVGIHTDISRSYALLADCYHEQGQPDKLGYLRDQVEHSTLTLKAAILRHIDHLIQE